MTDRREQKEITKLPATDLAAMKSQESEKNKRDRERVVMNKQRTDTHSFHRSINEKQMRLRML